VEARETSSLLAGELPGRRRCRHHGFLFLGGNDLQVAPVETVGLRRNHHRYGRPSGKPQGAAASERRGHGRASQRRNGWW